VAIACSHPYSRTLKPVNRCQTVAFRQLPGDPACYTLSLSTMVSGATLQVLLTRVVGCGIITLVIAPN